MQNVIHLRTLLTTDIYFWMFHQWDWIFSELRVVHSDRTMIRTLNVQPPPPQPPPEHHQTEVT